MKHYTTVVAALLLSAVLIFNPAAKAASASVTISSIPDNGYMNLIHQSTPQYDSTDNPKADVATFTYKGNFDVTMYISATDSYCNGNVVANVSFSFVTPTGFTFDSCNIQFNNLMSTNTCFAFARRNNGPAGGTQYIRCYFDNHWLGSAQYITLCNVEVTVTISKTITPYNLPDAPERISFSTSGTLSNNNTVITPDPADNGNCGVITNAILNAINDSSVPFDDILQVLEDIRTQDQTNYTTIVAYLADNDTFNSTLYTWLTTVLEDDFGALLDDTTYISSVLNAARNLINAMNSRDSLYYPIFEAALDLANTRLQTLINLMSETPAEAASMENAINQMESKQAAINDYSLPAAGNIIGNANSYVNQGTAGMNLLATILNQPLYILILMTVISLAFVSYLLYGKGV